MVLIIICAILIFSVIIFVHELGHFIAARIFGVKVLEFALGMGPTLWKKQGKETLYSVRAIPMGGFCSMEGEDEDVNTEGSFSSKPPLPKIVILAAGAGMNILLGFLVTAIIVTVTAVGSGGLPSTVVAKVTPDSAATFLQPGDKIVGINDKKVHIKRDLSFELSNIGETECSLTYMRDGSLHTEKFTPTPITLSDGSTAYVVGFEIAPAKITLGGILHESFFQTIWMVKLVFLSLGMLFKGQASVSDMSGPVGVVSAMSTAAQAGVLNLLFLSAFLTVNIGIMNLLPIPALDGGRIVFALFELIFRKPVPPDKEGLVHAVGFMLLIALMLFATWNDIVRLLS